MPISHALKLIFIHTPKCAGTSVASALSEVGAKFELSGLASRAERIRYGQVWMQHIPARTLRDDLSPEVWNEYYKIGFVRNPWDWMVSLFHYRFKRIGPRAVVPSDEDKRAFREWACRFCLYDPTGPRGVEYYLSDPFGNILVDYVGRYERLSVDFAAICEKIGVKATLPHLNASPRCEYAPYYDNRVRDIVGEKYARDIKRFGYTFNRAQ